MGPCHTRQIRPAGSAGCAPSTTAERRRNRPHSLLLGIGAPGDAGQVRGVLAPTGALVRKRHGQIVVHGDDDVTIVLRQFEFVQTVNVVPERGQSRRCGQIGFANQRERLFSSAFQRSKVSSPFGSFRISKTTLARIFVSFSDLLPEAAACPAGVAVIPQKCSHVRRESQ